MGEAVKPPAVLSEAPYLEYHLADKDREESCWFWDTQIPIVFAETAQVYLAHVLLCILAFVLPFWAQFPNYTAVEKQDNLLLKGQSTQI